MSTLARPNAGGPLPLWKHVTIIDAACAGTLAGLAGGDLPSEPEVWDRLGQLAAERGAALDPSSRNALFRAYRMGFARRL